MNRRPKRGVLEDAEGREIFDFCVLQNSVLKPRAARRLARFMASIGVQILEVFAIHEAQGRARHSVRAAPGKRASERRARSDAPYLSASIRAVTARRNETSLLSSQSQL